MPQRYVKINHELIPVTEEVYLAYNRPKEKERFMARRDGKCRQEDRKCPICVQTRLDKLPESASPSNSISRSAIWHEKSASEKANKSSVAEEKCTISTEFLK